MSRQKASERADVNDVSDNATTQIHCAYTNLVPLTELIENPRNPNTHPQRQIEMLGRIIVAQGWRAPITVSSRSGFIVRGHGRYRAALWAGLTHAPVDRQEYETEAAEWADLIADNRIAELSDMNERLLSELLKEFETIDIDLELTGYDKTEIDRLVQQYSDIEGSVSGENAGGDDSEKTALYRIIIDCATEQEQGAILSQLIDLGIPCKPLIL